MSRKSAPDLTPIPGSFREISWEIGESELQKSVMAVETFEALRDGQTNVRGIRAKICQKRKVKFNPSNPSTGKWAENPSDRFVNEHAWVLSMMNQFGMIEKVDQRTHQTALLPGGDLQLSAVVDFFRSNEPFEWKPGRARRRPDGEPPAIFTLALKREYATSVRARNRDRA